jgi:hypothetical protein
MKNIAMKERIRFMRWAPGGSSDMVGSGAVLSRLSEIRSRRLAATLGGGRSAVNNRRPGQRKTILTENEIGKIVVDAAFKVHRRPGPRLLESEYAATLAYDEREKCWPVVESRPRAG